MRIGLFSDTYVPQINGVATTVHNLAEELARLGHEVYIFCPRVHIRHRDKPNVIRFPAVPFPFERQHRIAFGLPARAWRILRKLEIVHSHTEFSLGTLALWAARVFRIPHVHTYHTHYVIYRHYLPPPFRPPRRLTEALVAAFCNRCDAVTVESGAMEEELRRYGVRRPIYRYPFGVNLRLYEGPLEHDLRAELGLPAGAKVFLYVGRIAKEKNLSFLLSAFAAAVRKRNDLYLVMVGGGPFFRALVEERDRLGLSGRVILAGYVRGKRLIDYYRGADVFVFASKTETLGLVVIEAMAAGLPVVCLGEMGVTEVVEDGVSGIFAPEDPVGFAEAMLEVLEDRRLRERIREGALRRARELSTEAAAERTLEVYEEVRAARASRGGDHRPGA
jgi:glycosyltransferase involved in cell wall biosynthesis